MKKKRNIKHVKVVIIIAVTLLLVATAVFFAVCYPCHFLWQEQNQIFLNSGSWIAAYFGRPAWLSCMAGDWVTQFYIYPIAGPAIQTLAIALCSALFAKAIAGIIRHKTVGWVLTGLFFILMLSCSFSSSSTLAFFLSVAGGIGLGLIRVRVGMKTGRKADLSPLLVPLSFWLFGFGALLTALFVAVSELKSRQWPFALCAVIFAAAMPAVLRETYSLPYSKAILYPGIVKPSLPETKFEERLAIADAFYMRHYDRTMQKALDAENPDEFTAFYYYLSSAVKDSLPEHLLRYPVKSLGTLTTIGESTPLPVINMMNDLYFELGDMTYAERAAMMRNVFSPRNRNVRMMRRLAEINLVSGDTLAARKYLGILDRTFAYSGWSRRHQPGNMSEKAENEVVSRMARSNKKDNIRLGDNCRHILLELLESNPHNTVALDYLLCTDLLLKDMDTFKMDYDTYCMEKGSPRYKDLYQQALTIYLAGTEAPEDEWQKYIVSPSIMEAFRQYSEKRGNPAFAGTYWYYFDRQ